MDDKIVRGREAWIDNVKMVAMLFVVFGHTPQIIHSSLPHWIGLIVISFHMPLFVVVSGFTSVSALDRIDSLNNLWKYVLKISKRMMMPCAFFSAVMELLMNIFVTMEASVTVLLRDVIVVALIIILRYFRNNSWGITIFNAMCIFSILLAAISPYFWFFRMLWCVCVCAACAAVITHWLNVSTAWGGQVLFFLISFLIALVAENFSSKTSDFILFFIGGYFLKKNTNLMTAKLSYITLFAVVGICLAVFLGLDVMDFWKMHFFQFVQQGKPQLYFFRIIASMLICLFFVLIIKLISGTYSSFSFWGSQTLGFYMVHSMFVILLSKFYYFASFNDIAYLFYSIPMTLLITIVTIFLMKLLMRFSLTNELCLGN